MQSHTRRPWVTRSLRPRRRTPWTNRKEYGGLPVLRFVNCVAAHHISRLAYRATGFVCPVYCCRVTGFDLSVFPPPIDIFDSSDKSLGPARTVLCGPVRRQPLPCRGSGGQCQARSPRNPAHNRRTPQPTRLDQHRHPRRPRRQLSTSSSSRYAAWGWWVGPVPTATATPPRSDRSADNNGYRDHRLTRLKGAPRTGGNLSFSNPKLPSSEHLSSRMTHGANRITVKAQG